MRRLIVLNKNIMHCFVKKSAKINMNIKASTLKIAEF